MTSLAGDQGVLQDAIERWLRAPSLMAREAYDPPPDREVWQEEGWDALVTDPRHADAACKGPGKSTKLSIGGLWILGCHENAQGEALAITAANLKDNLWKELGLWYGRSEFLKTLFRYGPERITSRLSPGTWFLAARSYAQDANPQEQAHALSGLHAAHSFYLLDEIGDMSPAVIDAAKGIFSVKGQHCWILAAGNRSTQRGALHYIETEDSAPDENGRPYWRITTITGDPDDPKRSKRIDIENARREIAAHGRDDPWVMVNILGLYPPQAHDQLIALNAIIAAQARDLRAGEYLGDARVWGIDPAYSERSGADEAVLCRRQGPLCRPAITWHGLDGPQLAAQVAMRIDEAIKAKEPPDVIFCDKGGVGASCYDHLKLLGWGHLLVGVDFGGNADDGARYYDKRTEMWVAMRDWVQSPSSCLPADPMLKKELLSPRYGQAVKGHQTLVKLEAKKDMKARGVHSPNRADALALTFAGPVSAMSAEEQVRVQGYDGRSCVTEYEMYAR
jgi:hypothetical protein